MGSALSLYPIDEENPGYHGKVESSQTSRGVPITALYCGCSQRTIPNDSQYQCSDLKSSIGSDENVLPHAENYYYTTHIPSPPYIGSSYGNFPTQELEIVHIVTPDLNIEIEIDVTERSNLISPPSSTEAIIELDKEINFETTQEENEYNYTTHSNLNSDSVLPRKLFDPKIDTEDYSSSKHEDDEEEDFDIVNPHSFNYRADIDSDSGDRLNSCHLLIPRCNSTQYLNSACLSLSLQTNSHFPRNRSAQTPPTIEATESDSSIDSSDISFASNNNFNRNKAPTLPSLEYGKPIRLKVTEKYTTSSNTFNSNTLGLDYFSYDPYFNIGEYSISDSRGETYGDDLHLKMSEQYMCLQDVHNRVWAVTRNRCTFLPSYVLYALIPRYEGQSRSTHRIINDIALATTSSDAHIHLYPWALIKKEGRRVDHDITIHMATEGEASILLDGQFETNPTYRTRQSLDAQRNHSYSVMYRISDNNTVAKPCCLFSRQMNNRNTFDVTISPGIDPLFMICSLAVQCKMDLEPKLNN